MLHVHSKPGMLGRTLASAAFGWGAIFLLAAAGSAPVRAATAAEKADDEPAEGKKKAISRLLPVPIFITEPAIGKGLGVAVAYFHGGSETRSPRVLSAEGMPETGEGTAPPTVTGVLAAYTESGTWAGGIGHSRSMWDDGLRYAGAGAYANISSTFYAIDLPIDFEIEGALLYQNARFRLGESAFFLGSSLSVFDTVARFQVDLPERGTFELGPLDSTNVGLSFQSLFETRDNTLTPNEGQLFDLSLWRYDEALGGDFDYWDTRLKLHSFHPLGSRIVLGLRLEGSTVDGKAPFWGYPWVSLRGIPAMRYQNQDVAVAETEVRFDVLPRWAVVGFFGAGFTGGGGEGFESRDELLAGGLGGRYLLMEDLGLWVGIDLAQGPEDTVWYIQAGHAW